MKNTNTRSMETLLEIMDRLRDPHTGCPWDLEQDFQTIVPHTLEEAYEVADCIERNDFDALPDELGDLLFQVVFYARLGREQGKFGFSDVLHCICDKLIRRHPHIFGDAERLTASDQSRAWEAQKHQEREAQSGADGSILDDIPLPMPALSRAAKLQRRAANIGFDWNEAAPAVEKIREEAGEILQALENAEGRSRLQHELGDLLFSCVNVARHLHLDPEQALRSANRRFGVRFRHIEQRLADQGLSMADQSLESLDALWEEAKSQSRD